MICLGFEGTAHSLGVGIVDDNAKILANVIDQYKTEEGGIHPREAADHHVENMQKVLKQALDESGLKMADIDLISFSQGPGLGPCLRTVATAARALSTSYSVPIIGVNHCIAHIEIGRALTGAKDPITTYVSGANTQIIGYESGKYRVFGETIDTGLGNLLDTFMRELGYGFPGGPIISKMLENGKYSYVELPYTVKGMDLVFSGLLTDALSRRGKVKNEDLIYSLTENAFAMTTEVTERALAHTGKNEVLLTGGVAASSYLRKMMDKMCQERGAKVFVPPVKVCVDNGAMIAWLGIVEHKSGIKMSLDDTIVKPSQRTDDIEVTWRV